MNNLYGSIQNGLRTSQAALQTKMNRADELMKQIDVDDPIAAKAIETELKDITTALTYFKAIEDLLVKMSSLPQ
ncbi:hypothetical protein D3C72_557630 [compost metagenome]|jgi:hypothetical protein